MSEQLFSNQSVIIILDVDALLFNRLQYLVEHGFHLVEINSADPMLFETILKTFKTLRVGAGNITSIEQLELCYKANVHFATSPGFLPALAKTALVYASLMTYIPGVSTPSDAMGAAALGYRQVRPYPVSLSFCALLNKSLPTLRLFPGEIDLEEAEHYLSLPAVAAISLLNPDAKQLATLSSSVFV